MYVFPKKDEHLAHPVSISTSATERGHAKRLSSKCAFLTQSYEERNGFSTMKILDTPLRCDILQHLSEMRRSCKEGFKGPNP